MGYARGRPPPSKTRYTAPYYEILAEMVQNSESNRYFKMNDDIVYIHPATFRNMIQSKNSELCCCFLHSANIVTNCHGDAIPVAIVKKIFNSSFTLITSYYHFT